MATTRTILRRSPFAGGVSRCVPNLAGLRVLLVLVHALPRAVQRHVLHAVHRTVIVMAIMTEVDRGSQLGLHLSMRRLLLFMHGHHCGHLGPSVCLSSVTDPKASSNILNLTSTKKPVDEHEPSTSIQYV